MPIDASGVVTYLLTDVESSSRHWEARPRAMRAALVLHDELVADTVRRHGGAGLTSRGEGDSFCAVFVRTIDAVAAAAGIQRGLVAQAWPDGVELRVRIAI